MGAVSYWRGAGKERGAAVGLLVIGEEQVRRGEQQWELLVIGEE